MGGLLFAQNYNFLVLTLNSPSTVVLLGKVTLGRRKKYHVLFIFPALRKTQILNYNRFNNNNNNLLT